VAVDSGLVCAATCTATYPSGTRVRLTPQPNPGWFFIRWFETDCLDGIAPAGSQDCYLDMSADRKATPIFDVVAPKARRRLKLVVHGEGSVRASLGGECPGLCDTDRSDGDKVLVSAQPAFGWRFISLSENCLPRNAQGSVCEVVMSADQIVTAKFDPAPPLLPSATCAGLMPPALPASVVASLPQNDCSSGTSDDEGSFLLGYTAGTDYHYPAFQVFTVRNRQAQQVGDTISGSDDGPMWAFSQPSGFTALWENDGSGFSDLIALTHDGTARRQPVTRDFAAFVDAAADPSGGTVLLRALGETSPKAAFRRFDAVGSPVTDWGPIEGTRPVFPSSRWLIASVAPSGDTLVLQRAETWQARWLDRSGVALTPWFELPAEGDFPVLAPLLDGSLALRFDWLQFPFEHGPWKYRLERGRTEVLAVPDWLRARDENAFFPVRGGRGYATWGLGGNCGPRLEVLDRSGAFCGCLEVPQLTLSRSSVGRDGSLIVGRGTEQFGTCRYDLYPQLFK
jgi:hypothetical protein